MNTPPYNRKAAASRNKVSGCSVRAWSRTARPRVRSGWCTQGRRCASTWASKREIYLKARQPTIKDISTTRTLASDLVTAHYIRTNANSSALDNLTK